MGLFGWVHRAVCTVSTGRPFRISPEKMLKESPEGLPHDQANLQQGPIHAAAPDRKSRDLLQYDADQPYTQPAI